MSSRLAAASKASDGCNLSLSNAVEAYQAPWLLRPLANVAVVRAFSSLYGLFIFETSPARQHALVADGVAAGRGATHNDTPRAPQPLVTMRSLVVSSLLIVLSTSLYCRCTALRSIATTICPSPPHTVSSPLWTLRGGAGLWGRLRSPSSHYRRMLVEQRDLLERQLRQTQDELTALKKKHKQLQTARLSSGADRSSQLRLLRNQVAELEADATALLEMRDDLVRMLEEEQFKVRTLEAKLAELQRSQGDVRAEYEWQIAEMRRDMEEQASRQLAELKAMMEARMQEALAKAAKAAEQERLAAVADAERRVQQQAQKELEKEQKKAAEAVEREKVKMRKLIKALAEREKKLLAQAEREKKAKGKSVSTSSARSKQQKHVPPKNVRGPIK